MRPYYMGGQSIGVGYYETILHGGGGGGGGQSIDV